MTREEREIIEQALCRWRRLGAEEIFVLHHKYVIPCQCLPAVVCIWQFYKCLLRNQVAFNHHVENKKNMVQ